MNKHHAPDRSKGFDVSIDIPGPLSAKISAALLGSVGDFSFVLDRQGLILDIAADDAELVSRYFGHCLGQPWIETTSLDSRDKVQDMLSEALTGKPARWRQVNHVGDEGDLPVRYLVVDLGASGHLIAIGRDMRSAAVMQQRLLQTQQSLERDYVRLRQAETRYRMLFDMAAEPVFIVDAATRRIREANPAAYRLLDANEGALGDQLVSSIVDAHDRESLIAHLGAAEASDDTAPVRMQLRGGGDAMVSARLFRQARTAMLLVRMDPVEEPEDGHQYDARMVDIIDRMPDAFVLCDGDLRVLAANPAFVELTEMPSIDRVRGGALGQWFGRSGIDLDLISGQLREHGSVRNVTAVVRGASGGEEEIEVSAVAVPSGSGDCFGFTIRSVGRRLRDAAPTGGQLPRSVDQLTELVGRMSLKDIVRESTDLIERLCIEAALSYTSDNRASAAEILGVSRQSLYSKLHRHGLGNLVPDAS